MLNITRARHSCTVFAAQAEAMYKPKASSHCCLLCARCVKLRKSRIKNLSHRLFHMLNLSRCSFHLCLTIMTTSSGAICLYLVSRERFAKVAQFCRANNAPMTRPFAIGNARRVGGTSAARRVSSKARSRQMLGSASGDPMMV